LALKKNTRSKPVLVVENISKRYSYGPILSDASKLGGKKSQDTITALENISFTLCRGEILGVIGNNGSGKSTLLKLISGISNPTSGKVVTYGRVASILEIGTGFHPDLSGKDNVFLSGAILGMSNKDLRSVYNDIVQFSGLEDFINLPIKKYSSGMYMRLAFSVVAHVNADIVLLDEVFSVGDASFIRKSERKIRELIVSNRTIIIASHDLNSISKIASSLMVLKNGTQQYFGGIEEGLNTYIESSIFQTETVTSKEPKPAVEATIIEESHKNIIIDEPRVGQDTGPDVLMEDSGFQISDSISNIRYATSKKISLQLASNTFTINSVSILNADAEEVTNEQPIDLCFDVSVLSNNNYQLALALSHNLQSAVLTSTAGPQNEARRILKTTGNHQIKFSLPPELLNSGVYAIGLYVVDSEGREADKAEDLYYFKVVLSESFRNKMNFRGHFPGPLVSQFSWSVATLPKR
jgi:ABC-type polysaccharide/polyol phosphate transport system ATPase subunit